MRLARARAPEFCWGEQFHFERSSGIARPQNMGEQTVGDAVFQVDKEL